MRKILDHTEKANPAQEPSSSTARTLRQPTLTDPTCFILGAGSLDSHETTLTHLKS